MRRLLSIATLGLAVVALIVGLAAFPTGAADHLDAPGTMPPGGDTRLDINDVYAFQSPANAANTVLIMTVNPLAGMLNNGTFHPDASYDLPIDTNGDAKEDLMYRITFSAPDASLVQDVRLRLVGAGAGSGVLASGQTGQNIPVAGGGMLRAGVFDDPFFFDLVGFLSLNLCNPGTNFFTGLNTSAIVLEVPSASLGPSNIGVWARTYLNDQQIDRMGRPAINTVFIPNNVFEPVGTEPSQRNAFNSGKPRHDQRDFRGEVVDTLEIFYGAGNPTAGALADILLPDILTVDTSNSAGFLNGRRLADDVIDIELGIVTNGMVTTDCVANDSSFSTTFPYLAPAN